MLTPTKPVKSCECGGSCGGCCCCTKESIGLGNVDNTSDLNKPLSTDMVNALSGKVNLDIFTQLKNRVLALESTITEIPDLKVRIGQCELDIIDNYEAIKRLQSTTKSMADTITELGNRVTGVSDDIVTLETGKANNTDVVHKTGNEDINGSKTFYSGIMQGAPKLDLHDTSKGYTEGGQKNIIVDKNKMWLTDSVVGQNSNTVFKYDRIRCDDGNGGTLTAGLRMILNPTGFIFAIFNGSVQDNVITTSVLNSYAPMVRTTGNQTISGIKEFLRPIIACINKGRITDNLDIEANYDGMGIYYIYMNNVKTVKGVPADIENGGAILYHSREYSWGDSNNNYIYYNQMLISSEGQLYIRRHIQTISKSTNDVTWGTENWRKYNYTTVSQIEGINS